MMNTDSALFRDRADLFDHRFGTYAGQTQAQANQGKLPELSDEQHADPLFLPEPKFWMAEAEVESRIHGRWARDWVIGWRDITGATVMRTIIAAVIPRVGAANSLPLMFVEGSKEAASLLANLSSFAFHFVARQKTGGTHVNFFILEQLPVLPPSRYAVTAPWDSSVTLSEWIRPRVLELEYGSWDLAALAEDLGWQGPPFRWNPNRRAILRAELDAAFFHLYEIERNDIDYIMQTFLVARRNDERAYGEFLTKRLVLERFDAIAHAAESGLGYVSSLEPPPSDPRVAHNVGRGGAR